VLGERLLLQDCAIVLVRRESPSTWDLGARTREGEESRESETAPLLLYRPLSCSPPFLLSCPPACCCFSSAFCSAGRVSYSVVSSSNDSTQDLSTSVPTSSAASADRRGLRGSQRPLLPGSLQPRGSHASAANPEDEPCSAAVDTALARGSVCRTPLPGPGCCMAGCRLAAEALQRHNGGGSPTSMLSPTDTKPRNAHPVNCNIPSRASRGKIIILRRG
jgi:hypothetical protein